MATFYSFLGATVLQEILEEVRVKVRKLEEKYKKKMEEKGLVSLKVKSTRFSLLIFLYIKFRFNNFGHFRKQENLSQDAVIQVRP